MTAAIHEAAHAVLVRHFGGWIYPEGVTVAEGQGLCTYGLQETLRTERAEVCIALAGYMAKMHHCALREGLPSPGARMHPAMASICLQNARAGLLEDDGEFAFHRLLMGRPRASDAALCDALARYEDETFALVTRPDVWGAIEALADLIEQRGRVSHAQVRAWVPYSVLHPFLRPGVVANGARTARRDFWHFGIWLFPEGWPYNTLKNNQKRLLAFWHAKVGDPHISGAVTSR